MKNWIIKHRINLTGLGIYLFIYGILTWPAWVSHSLRVTKEATPKQVTPEELSWIGVWMCVGYVIFFLLGAVLVSRISDQIATWIYTRKQDPNEKYDDMLKDMDKRGVDKATALLLLIDWIKKFDIQLKSK
jgi:hypothetical protein